MAFRTHEKGSDAETAEGQRLEWQVGAYGQQERSSQVFQRSEFAVLCYLFNSVLRTYYMGWMHVLPN